MNPIICLAGPTASGKTALAVELAKELDGEVVSCDSMQVYRRMNIGTAKPTKEEMQGIPHHMIDVASPEEDYSVSRYCAQASPIVEDIVARGKTAIIAGGTGLYMDSLIRGNDFAPFPSTGVRQRLEAQADAEGLEAMAAWLHAVDPEAAERIQDRKRLLRALEVYLETGETISAHNAATRQLPPRYDAVWIGLQFADRADMKALIDRTVAQWLTIKNKEFYYIMTAAEESDTVMDCTLECFRGLAKCLEGSVERGVIYGKGVYGAGEIESKPAMREAYDMGRKV